MLDLQTSANIQHRELIYPYTEDLTANLLPAPVQDNPGAGKGATKFPPPPAGADRDHRSRILLYQSNGGTIAASVPASSQPGPIGQLPLYQPAEATALPPPAVNQSLTNNPKEGREQSAPAPVHPAGAICNPTDQPESEVPENQTNQPGEDDSPTPVPPPASAQPADAVWTPDEEMEPPTPPPGPTGQDAPAAMGTVPSEEGTDAMCPLQITPFPSGWAPGHPPT